MSTISSSTTSSTAYKVTADTTGTLVLQTGATPTTAVTISSAQVVTLANALPVASGGTGVTSNAAAPFALKGANSDITSLTGLTTPLSVAQGGTGAATLTANNVLLGNGTSAPQFVAPSTSGNVLTSNGTTWSSSALAALGIGQTWTVVTGSRAIGTTYTNSTGKPIFIAVTGYVNTGAQTITVTVAGATAFQYYTAVGTNARSPLYFPIPVGATYAVSGFNVLEYWSELR